VHKKNAGSTFIQWVDMTKEETTHTRDDDASLLFFQSLLSDMKMVIKKTRRKVINN
jgi:phosphoenolpyruvate carboxylase